MILQAAAASIEVHLESEAATAGLARRLAPLLGAGSLLLLDGETGAGKTHFSRALIRAKLGTDEEVPSPTYTLVQVYEAPDCAIWHCDLYRLAAPDEVLELGLEEALPTALCLVEWPGVLEGAWPPGALRLRFRPGESEAERTVRITGERANWQRVFAALGEPAPAGGA